VAGRARAVGKIAGGPLGPWDLLRCMCAAPRGCAARAVRVSGRAPVIELLVLQEVATNHDEKDAQFVELAALFVEFERVARSPAVTKVSSPRIVARG